MRAYRMTEETARNLFWGFYSRLPQSEKNKSCNIKKKSCEDKLFDQWLRDNHIELITGDDD